MSNNNIKPKSIEKEKMTIYEKYIQPLIKKIPPLPTIDEKYTPYYKINSTVGKVVFILFIVILFIIVFNLGMFLINSFLNSSKNSQIYLIKGISSGYNPQVIIQDPKNEPSKYLPRSNNRDKGAEFTWSIWLKVDDIVGNGQNQTFQHIFNKGNNDYNAITGISTVNNAPGLYLSKGTNSLRVIMDTVAPNPNTDNKISEITNIPLKKWFHVIIRLQNRTLDTYVNGIITTRLYLINVPKQNYDPVYICRNGGFSGSYSDLSYFNYALPIHVIQSMVYSGPRLTYSTEQTQIQNDTVSRSSISNYLSPLWYFGENTSEYGKKPPPPPPEQTTNKEPTPTKQEYTENEHKVNNENYDKDGNLVETGVVLQKQETQKETQSEIPKTMAELKKDSKPFTLNLETFYTEFTNFMFGDVRVLDKHNIDCKNAPINSFKFNYSSNGNINYSYTCNNPEGGTLNVIDVQPTSTMFSDTTGKSTDLKGQSVKCPSNSVLSQFQLVNNTPIGEELKATQLQYKYKCYESKEPTPLTCRTDKTPVITTNTKNMYLAKANIKCRPDEALSGFEYILDEPTKFHYNYTCCSTAYSNENT